MSEDKIWWTVFVVSFVSIAMAETFLPFRRLRTSTPRRWVNNSTPTGRASSVAVGCVYQLTGIALAFWAARQRTRGAKSDPSLLQPAFSYSLCGPGSDRLCLAPPLSCICPFVAGPPDPSFGNRSRFGLRPSLPIPWRLLLTHGLLLVSDIVLIGAPRGHGGILGTSGRRRGSLYARKSTHPGACRPFPSMADRYSGDAPRASLRVGPHAKYEFRNYFFDMGQALWNIPRWAFRRCGTRALRRRGNR